MHIDWQSVLITVFVALGGSVAIPVAVAWLLKTAFTEWLARETKAFETNLKANADIEIERLKNSLRMLAVEHQVRFSKLHEKRAELIGEVYKRLTSLNLNGERFVITAENNPTPYKEKEFADLRQELSDVFIFVEQNRIYLPEDVCALLDKHLGQIRSTVWSAGIFGRIETPNDHTLQQSYTSFTKAYEDFETVIPAARKSLEKEFRRMLGVEPG